MSLCPRCGRSELNETSSSDSKIRFSVFVVSLDDQLLLLLQTRSDVDGDLENVSDDVRWRQG